MKKKAARESFINFSAIPAAMLLMFLILMTALGGCTAPAGTTPSPVSSVSPQGTSSPETGKLSPSPGSSFVPGVGGGDAGETIEQGGRAQNQLGRKGIQKLQQIDSQHNGEGQEP